MLGNSSKQTVSRWDLEGLSGLIVFFHSGLPLGRRFPIPLKFWMNEHSSVFASDCESQGKWLSAYNLETLFRRSDCFFKIRIYSFGRLICVPANYSVLEIYISLPCNQSQLCWKSRVQAKLADLSINLRISSTFTSSLHFREVRPLPREGYLVCPLVWPFLFCRFMRRERWADPSPKFYFWFRWEAKKRYFALSFMTCGFRVFYVWLSLLGFFLGLILLFFQK